MSREIKFRVWNPNANKFVSYAGINEMPLHEAGALIVKIPVYEILQYTGLKDKNGVEIYEGDLVECEQMQGLGKFKGIVHYSDNTRVSDAAAAPHLNPDPRIYLDTRPWSFGGLGGEFCVFHYNPEVIGNIHENHELLKETS